jgi:hypothetical protein
MLTLPEMVSVGLVDCDEPCWGRDVVQSENRSVEAENAAKDCVDTGSLFPADWYLADR